MADKNISRGMVRLRVLASCLLLCWAVLPLAGLSATVVNFPDANLEQVVRDAIDKPAGDIYDTDLVGLDLLDAWGWDIVDLTGLEYCVDLEYLYLDSNEISDISPLSGLSGLSYLNLTDNEVSDLSPLAGLTGLEDLLLDENLITDVSSLSAMTGLLQLSLMSNQIADVTPLAGLVNLEDLILFRNEVSDMTPLSGLTGLIYLDLGSNLLDDISALSGLADLAYLYVDGNQVSDIAVLEGLSQLDVLYLNDNQISDIQALVDNLGLGSGDEVYLSGNPLSAEALSVQVPALESRGVLVFIDPVFPWEPSVLPGEYINFRTLLFGTITWSLPQNNSGGSIDADSGLYHAGLTADVDDALHVAGDSESADMAIHVISARPVGEAGPPTSMDVDGEGVGSSDVAFTLACLVGVEVPTPAQFKAADFDSNGSLSLLDVINATRVAGGLAPLP